MAQIVTLVPRLYIVVGCSAVLRRLDGLHNSFPLIVLQLEIKGFFCSVLYRAVSGSHFIPSEARDNPLEALVRQNLDLEADKLDFLRIGEVAISLVNYTVGNGPVDGLQSSALLHP